MKGALSVEEVQRNLREIRDLAPQVFDEWCWAFPTSHDRNVAGRDRIARTATPDPTGNVAASKQAMRDNLRRAADDVAEALSRLRRAHDRLSRSMDRDDPHVCPKCLGRRYIEGQICDKCRGTGDRLEPELEDSKRTQDYITSRKDRERLVEAQDKRKASGEHIPS